MNRSTADCPASLIRIDSENLDAAYAPRFEATLRDALKCGPVILDLEGVRFADSIGIGLLVSAARRREDKVRITNVGPSLRRCLDRARSATLPAEICISDLATASSNAWVLPFPAASSADDEVAAASKQDHQEFGT